VSEQWRRQAELRTLGRLELTLVINTSFQFGNHIVISSPYVSKPIPIPVPSAVRRPAEWNSLHALLDLETENYLQTALLIFSFKFRFLSAFIP